MLRGLAGWAPRVVETWGNDAAALGVGRFAPGSTDGLAVSEDGSVHVVIDGRLDYLDELRRSLGLTALAPPAGVVAAGFRRWGDGVLGRLHGEFAALIWDGSTGTLVAARDPLGIRPLYYGAQGACLALGSDPEQLLASRLISGELDDDSVVDHLMWTFTDAERSFFRNIRRVPGGHFLVANTDGFAIREYHRPISSEVSFGAPEECRAEFLRLFSQSVRRRISSSAPVVAHLSGGLDSTAIVSVADRILADAPELCPGFVAAAAVYPGLVCDEQRFVRAVERHVRVPVETWDGTDTPRDELDDVFLSAPIGRFTYIGGTQGDTDIARAKGGSVVLSGVGGDQVGVPDGAFEDAIATMRWGDARAMLRKMSGSATEIAMRTVSRLARAAAPGWSWLRTANALVQHVREERPRWMTGWARSHFQGGARRRRSHGALRSQVQRLRWSNLTSPRFSLVVEYIQQHALRNGMEVRFPFRDAQLISFILSIPSSYWPPPGPGERIHREALGDVLPPEIARRRGKANFTSALANRVRRQLPRITELFNSSAWAAERYVDQKGALSVLAEFQRLPDPSFDATYAVWGIATLEAWLRAVSIYSVRTRSAGAEAYSYGQ